MGQSFQDLLDEFVRVRDEHASFRQDAQKNAGRIQRLESVVQTMLEKLRDRLDP